MARYEIFFVATFIILAVQSKYLLGSTNISDEAPIPNATNQKPAPTYKMNGNLPSTSNLCYEMETKNPSTDLSS